VDTGPGIPAEARDRVFEKFTQLDRGALRGHKGTGLGLTFCQLAVEAHGGRIWVEDGPEGGAAFCFTLPLAPDEP
jgi:signal transduction histidine kinase